MATSKRVAERITGQLKKYQTILAEAKNRDISESDTVVIIVDMLADILGYKKYIEITTEFSIRNTYVDLAVKVGAEIRFLLEVKAIGVSLKDVHIKQAVDYGANQGIEWVILTNGAIWQIYKVNFAQPIDKVLIYEVNLLQESIRSPKLIECLGNISREGFTQSSMAAFSQQQQVTSKFSLAAILLSEPLLKALRKELKRISPTLKIEEDALKTILQNDVLKRDVIESEEAKQAVGIIKRATKAAAKNKVKTQAVEKQKIAEEASIQYPALVSSDIE